MRETFLPVLIFVGLHRLKALEYADSLVHGVVCSTGTMLLQWIIGQGKPVRVAVENGTTHEETSGPLILKKVFHTGALSAS
jgi:hypothetical protein